MADQFLTPTNPYDEQARRLEERRRIARQMVERAHNSGGAGYHGGRVFMVGNQLGNVAQALAGAYAGNSADADIKELVQKRMDAQSDWQQQFGAAQDPAEKQRLLADAANQGLRHDLEKQFMEAASEAEARKAEKEAAAIARREDLAIKLNSEAEMKREHDKAQIELRKTPIVQRYEGGGGNTPRFKVPVGYMLNEAGDGVEPIPGIVPKAAPADKSNATKPLTAKQLETQRGFMDLESSVANYEKLLDAYDFQGKSAINPAKRAALEGAYTDVQMKMKTLYELGAPQAGDLKLLAQGIPSPVDLQGTLRGAAFGSSPFKAKLGETRKLLNSSRTNFETQFGKATPEAAKPPAASSKSTVAPGTRGIHKGKPVIMGQDGEWKYVEVGK